VCVSVCVLVCACVCIVHTCVHVCAWVCVFVCCVCVYVWVCVCLALYVIVLYLFVEVRAYCYLVRHCKRLVVRKCVCVCLCGGLMHHGIGSALTCFKAMFLHPVSLNSRTKHRSPERLLVRSCVARTSPWQTWPTHSKTESLFQEGETPPRYTLVASDLDGPMAAKVMIEQKTKRYKE
jgi:hypothetical protein